MADGKEMVSRDGLEVLRCRAKFL